MSEGTLSPATMQAVPSACPVPLGLEQGERYGALRRMGKVGWGSSSWVWVKAAELGTPLIPAARGGTGLVGKVRLRRSEAKGSGSG